MTDSTSAARPAPDRRPVSRSVRLRDERTETDRQVLDASIDEDGALRIDGHDLGPGTRAIRAEGEYEWRWTIASSHIPLVRAVVGCAPGEDLLGALAERYRGERSHELERLLRESEIPREFWSWP